MIIKNFEKLSSNKTRKDALSIINAGIEAALVEKTMRSDITFSNNTLRINDKEWKIPKNGKIYVVGAGKAAANMARVIEEKLKDSLEEGIVIDTRDIKLKKVIVVKGTHPLPSQTNINAAKRIVKLLEKAGKDDIVINLISGGGSALLAYPRISVKDLIKVNKLLLEGGASIEEINSIRKHISRIKGGQLSELAGKAKVITLIVSDVITNDLSVIASGPTVKDSTTINDAEAIRKKYHLPKLPFVETPKKKHKNTTNILLITNVKASEAMKKKAQSLGYKVNFLTSQMKGEAKEVGEKLAKMEKEGTAIIAAGEPTVTIKGKGKGGRAQELVLSAARFLKKGVVISSSTDGVDFITEAAGAIADSETIKNGRKKKMDAEKYLKNNDSYNFLKKVNGIIKTGKTGTNVGDLMLVLEPKGNKDKRMKIFIGSDHAGFEYKKKIAAWLEKNYDVSDMGPNEYNPKDDYPIYSFAVAEKVAKTKDSAGIIIARSGIGEAIAANKVRSVRAVSFTGKADNKFLKMSRVHDHTNVLCFGSDFVSLEEGKKAIRVWLKTEFLQGERHKRRLKEVSDYEKKHWKK